MKLVTQNGQAEMFYTACPSPDLIFSTSYDKLLAFSEGEIAPDDFARNHSHLEIVTPGKEIEFMALMSGAIEMLNS